MASCDIQIVEDDLMRPRYVTPTIEIGKMQFKFFIRFHATSVRRNITVKLKSMSLIHGFAYIIGNITFIHPNGPHYDMIYSFSHAFSENDKSFSQQLEIDFEKLVKKHIYIEKMMKLKLELNASPEIERSIGRFYEVPDLHQMIKQILSPHDFSQKCTLSNSNIAWIISSCIKVLKEQPTLLYLDSPIVVVGDLHGNFCDLLRIFQKFGCPNRASYLFLGDYVDRGIDGVDICLLLFCFKILYPNNIFLLRGNHEFADICGIYGFLNECEKKHVNFSAFIEAFGWLPIAAVVSEKIFCCHGGLSLGLELEDISNFKRPESVSYTGHIHDIMWSDPNKNLNNYGRNTRGSSTTYGVQAVENFLNMNGMNLLVRAHEFAENGYEMAFGKDPIVLTVFSSSDYIGNNPGSVLVVDEDLNYQLYIYKSIPEHEKVEMQSNDFSDIAHFAD